VAVVTMKQLLEAGVHFGHQTRRWNPKMRRYIFGERAGIYIIDLRKTLNGIEQAYVYVRDLVADGGTIMFVGTKKQTQDPVARFADECGMPYVNQRWLGGMLTNFTTMGGRVRKMQDLERMRAVGDFDAMPKKEALMHSRELEKLQRNLGGIRGLSRLPNAVFIIDTKKEHIAVTEANKLGLPIVAVVDTNCDPDVVQFVIPGNDDAIRAGSLLCRVIADAVKEGQHMASRRGRGDGPGFQPPALTPEQEAARAEQQAEARRQAALAQREREARLASGDGTAATGDGTAAGTADEASAPAAPAASEPSPTPAAEAVQPVPVPEPEPETSGGAPEGTSPAGSTDDTTTATPTQQES
jgi:small subunit ribosomal protein S2